MFPLLFILLYNGAPGSTKDCHEKSANIWKKRISALICSLLCEINLKVVRIKTESLVLTLTKKIRKGKL
jgi:hypothetical protein